MIYIDTSVALVHLLGEDRTPPDDLWTRELVSSRLLEYESWTRLHAYGLGASLADALRAILGRVALVRMEPMVLRRVLGPFPRPVRTLDAIHLASFHYLREHAQDVALASYDERQLDVARALGWAIHACG